METATADENPRRRWLGMMECRYETKAGQEPLAGLGKLRLWTDYWKETVFLMVFLMRISCEGLRLSHSHHPYKGMRREKVEQDRPVSRKMERGHISKMKQEAL